MTTPEDRLTKLETSLWGAYGTSGISSDVKRHGEQIGDLYGRDETLRSDINQRLDKFEDRQNSKLDGLYKLVATLIVSILIGAGGIVATLVVTSG